MTDPWKHQEDALTCALPYDAYMFAHDMGCGKSFEAVEYANRVDAWLILIFCPKSVVSVWPDEFKKHSKNKFDVVPLIKGTVKDKAKRLESLLHIQKLRKSRLAVVVNYDSAWRSGLGPDYRKKRIVKPGVILSHKWDLVIADESHRAKDPTSKISWFMYQISKRGISKRRLALTGTPMPHSPLDIYAQFRFLDWKIFKMTFTEFRNRYAVMKDFGDFKKPVGFQREDELNAIFYSRAHRVMKRDVLDLPPVMHEKRFCDLDPKTMKLYLEVEHEFYSWLEEQGDSITIETVLTKILRLGQITGGYLQLDSGESTIVDNSKLNLLSDIFQDLPTDEPVVVFARFTNEIARIKELAEKLGRPAAELSGNMNQLKEWKAGEYNVIAVQIRAGGVGIDLTRAHYTVYYSHGYSLGDFEQSLARTDRPGQTKPGVFYHLLAHKTIDIDVFRSLETKKKVVEGILNLQKVAA